MQKCRMPWFEAEGPTASTLPLLLVQTWSPCLKLVLFERVQPSIITFIAWPLQSARTWLHRKGQDNTSNRRKNRKEQENKCITSVGHRKRNSFFFLKVARISSIFVPKLYHVPGLKPSHSAEGPTASTPFVEGAFSQNSLPFAQCRFPLHTCRQRYHFSCTSWTQNFNSLLCRTIMPFSPSTTLSFCLPQRASTRPHIWNQNSICIKTETRKGQGKGLVHFTHGKIHSLSTTRHLTYRTVPFSIARMSTEISLLLFIDIPHHHKAARVFFLEIQQKAFNQVAARLLDAHIDILFENDHAALHELQC